MRLALSLLIASLLATSCGLKFGQHPQQNVELKLGDATACLNSAGQTMGDYFKGTSTDRQVSDLFNCASSAIHLFRTRVRGAGVEPGTYTMEQLRNFMQTYFLVGLTISDPFLVQIEALKQTLIGGRPDTLTSDDLDRLENILNLLKDRSLKLRPFFPLTADHMNSFSPQDLETAIEIMNETADTLGSMLVKYAVPYSFLDQQRSMDAFLQQAETFVTDPNQVIDLSNARQYLPLIAQLKGILVSPDTTSMKQDDWGILFTTGVQIYEIYLRVEYIMNQNKGIQFGLFSGDGRKQIQSVLDHKLFGDVNPLDGSPKGNGLLQKVLSRNPLNTMTYCNLFNVIDEVSKLYGARQALAMPYNKDTDDPEDYRYYFMLGDIQLFRGTLKKLVLPFAQKFFKPVNDPLALVWNGPGLFYTDACSNQPYAPAGGQPSGRTKAQLGIVQSNLNVLQGLIDNLFAGEFFLEKSFEWAANHDQLNEVPNTNLTDVLTRVVKPQNLRSYNGDYNKLYGGDPVPSQMILNLMGDMIDNHLPMYTDENGLQMTFSAHSRDRFWTFKDLTWINAITQLARLVWAGYTNPKDYYQDPDTCAKTFEQWDTYGILEDKIQAFYEDIKEVGVAVKLFDPNDGNAAVKRFLESNLLVYDSDGNSFMSTKEATDLVLFLISAKMLADRTYEHVHNACVNDHIGCPTGEPQSKDGKPWSCNIGPVDLYGKDHISAQCYYRHAFNPGDMPYPTHAGAPDTAPDVDTYNAVFDHFPMLSDYYTHLPKLSDDAKFDNTKVYRETYRCMLERVVRGPIVNPDWYDSSDIDQLSAIYGYIEGLYVRYSSNPAGYYDHPPAQNVPGAINQDDANAAFDLLKFELKTQMESRGLSMFSGDNYLHGVLDYLLAGGTIPSLSSNASIGDWLSALGDGIDIIWRSDIHSCGYNADRSRITQVIALLTGHTTDVCFLPPAEQYAELKKEYQQQLSSGYPPHAPLPGHPAQCQGKKKR